MNDDFIRALKQTWQSQDHDASKVLQRLRRHRWTAHLVLAGELLALALALLCGLWFAWAAIHPGPFRLLFALSAAVMLITVPVVCVLTVRARWSGLAWHDEPRMLLAVGIRRAEGALQIYRMMPWSIGVIAAFVAVLWVCQALGLLHALGFLIFYTAFCLVASLATWSIMVRQQARLRAERDACIRLLAMMEAEVPDRPATPGDPS